MTLNKVVEYILILVFVIGGLVFAYKIHEDVVEQARREVVAQSEGRYQELRKQDSIKSMEIIYQRRGLDSLKRLYRPADTIPIYVTHEKQINNIRELDADSSIGVLAKNIGAAKARHER